MYKRPEQFTMPSENTPEQRAKKWEEIQESFEKMLSELNKQWDRIKNFMVEGNTRDTLEENATTA